VVNLCVYDLAQTDEAVFRKLSKFLNVDTHLVNFLLKAPGGMASSRLRVGNIKFSPCVLPLGSCNSRCNFARPSEFQLLQLGLRSVGQLLLV
jgi:hypothetical protein